MSGYWGHHLHLDVAGCNNAAIQDKETVAKWIKDLVQKIDMVAYGEPVIENFALHDPTKAGISAVQLIETSNICAHFVNENNTFYMDVFSCKPFSNDDVIALVNEYFKPSKVRVNYVTRCAG